MPRYLPVDEDHPLSPHDPYGLGKLCEEEIGRSYMVKCDMETVFLRPARVLFPEDRAQLYRDGGFLPASFNLCAYSDVRDLAVAFRQALEAPGLGHEVAFVVNDDSLCPEPLCDVLPRVMPTLGDLASGLTGDKPGVSNARVKQLLGWKPRFTWRTPGDGPSA
jgi:nucleoside-diphosphate-sugar epimerase